ncbi:class I adenylate-forming enzyme family protein [Actinocorallia sp. B10E7]|uniref:class I adenylate-forming enzyme family protein n=1 Tax=Actinocorallia sp. B10E7 TaxID=3153558 RepID=UPI00325F93E2
MIESAPHLHVHDMLDVRVLRSPERPALRSAGVSWSYGELGRRSLAIAERLRALGVGRGDRVLIDAPHAPETVAAVFAVSRLGALYAVVSDRLPEARFERVVADCTPKLLLTARDGPRAGLPWERLEKLPAEAEGPAAEELAAVEFPSIDPVGLIYTSGSTSEPKAVVSTHAQVLFAADAIQDRLRYRDDDVIFSCLPLSFDYGLYQVFLSCLGGAELILATPEDAGPALLRRLEEESPTVLPLVPSLAGTLLTLIRRGRRAPEGLRMITSSGAALSGGVAQRLRDAMPGLGVVSMFGLTECKRVSISEPDADVSRPGTMGRPLRGTEVLILDDRGEPVPVGETGELVVRGGHVMAGYWNAPELTARRFRRDAFGQPLLFTGDKCRLDEDGHLYFVGRDDDLYKENGFRVSATEVEAAALDVAGVRQAAVLPPRDGAGSVLVVSADLSADEVLRELSSRLEDFKVPRRCRVVPELPLGANGKLDRRAVAALGGEA